MTQPKRPRKPAPRPGARSEMDTGVALTIDGETHEVRLGDISANVAREFRREVGMSARSFLFEQMVKDPDIDSFATFVWLARLIKGEQVDLDSIAITYGMLGDSFELAVLDKPAEDEDAPEA